jgi:hypothetical protein
LQLLANRRVPDRQSRLTGRGKLRPASDLVEAGTVVATSATAQPQAHHRQQRK